MVSFLVVCFVGREIYDFWKEGEWRDFVFIQVLEDIFG
jgi:hypothetical protein